MSEGAHLGLAGLLAAMEPRGPKVGEPPVDVEAVRAEAWEQGFAAGVANAEAGLAPLRVRLGEAAAALDAAAIIDVDRLRPLLAAVVRGVAEAVVAAELRIEPAVLLRLVETALALVQPGEVPVLRAHPATLALLAPHLPDLAVVADAGLAEDGFEVAGTDFVIAAGLGARLDEIMGEVA